ncbi:hypothetical protein BAE44_0000584 [Dichanthelium oligosanthes]|uniref:BTB domain-containing protein n=1 Tax=Dichanthelium oligosanthes TaxID=888268 RepID=A0A1E5WLV9_9POAL|nr:hypothetical protein BAE44_0000584 [Dichanthelium oligosanthes]
MPPTESAAKGGSWLNSASSIVGETVSGHHLLYIDGYSCIKEELPTGKYIKSRPFRAGDGYWRTSKLVPGYTRSIYPREYSAGDHGCGIATFIKRDWLEKSEHLLDDCLKISCEVIVYKELRTEDRIAPASFPSVVVPPSNLNLHLGNLFTTKDGADVTFQVAGETFKAHRFLLAARSLVFKAELLGGMKESTSTGDCIRIDDMSPHAVPKARICEFLDLNSWRSILFECISKHPQGEIIEMTLVITVLLFIRALCFGVQIDFGCIWFGVKKGWDKVIPFEGWKRLT